MRRIRVEKPSRRHVRRRLDVLPLDPRDPDIVWVKTRGSSGSTEGTARSGGRGNGTPRHGRWGQDDNLCDFEGRSPGDLGGRASDPWLLTLLAAVFVAPLHVGERRFEDEGVGCGGHPRAGRAG